MMNCLIYEPDATGHRLQHVRHLTEALLEIGCRVTLALETDCRDRKEYQVHLRELEPHVELRPYLDPRQGVSLGARRQRVAELLEAVATLRPDWAYVPYADGTTQAAALECLLSGGGRFRQVPIEAQIMRGRYGYPSRSILQSLTATANRWLTRRSPWHVTHVLDPFALRGLEPLANPAAFSLIPEPVETLPLVDRQEARRALGVPVDGRYLAFVGGLTLGKGIEPVLESLTRAKLRRNDRLLLIGKMDARVGNLLREKYGALFQQDRLAIVDRYVTDHELHCGFRASDVVAVTHPRQIGSSGTLVRAAAAQRPVLASHFGWVGWVTETFGLGTTVNVADVGCLASAIEVALNASGEYRHSSGASRFGRYHTVANQQAHWVAAIGCERQIPLGRLAERIDWSWVLQAADGGAAEVPVVPKSRIASVDREPR